MLGAGRRAHRARDGLPGGQAPGELAQQVALRQDGRCGLGVRRDRRQRQREQDAGDRGVDLLVVLDLPVAEVEEGLPADVASRGRVAAEQVGAVVGDRTLRSSVRWGRRRARRTGWRWVGAVAGAAGEVGAVGGADHAVPEPVGGGGELDRHERLPLPGR